MLHVLFPEFPKHFCLNSPKKLQNFPTFYIIPQVLIEFTQNFLLILLLVLINFA